MAIVDTSAALRLVVSAFPDERLNARLAREHVLRAPHLIDVEFLHALRRLVRTNEISEEVAGRARERFGALRLVRFPHGSFRDRIWELRNNFTAYDAAYVALAEALGLPLITTDARLAGAAGHRAEIELFAG